MSLVFEDLAVCFVAAILAYFIWSRQSRARSLPHPPGPPGLPLIGNLRDMPPDPAWTTYLSWSERYGNFSSTQMACRLIIACTLESDIIRLNVLGRNIIILNSLIASVDLLERRSSIYSDRYVCISSPILSLMGFRDDMVMLNEL